MIRPDLTLSVVDETAPQVVTAPERTDEDMSTDQHLKPRTPSPDEPTPTPPPKASKLDLSVTKILGGALAAMTAAALGSRLSVAGTIVGAAIASIIAAVASALYTASLKHTQEKVKTVFTGRAPGSDLPTTIEVVSDHDTRVIEAVPSQPSAPHWDLPADVSSRGPRRKVSWKSILVGALAAFGITAVTLTGFELVSGQALSGGDGTTITQVGSGNTGGTGTKSEKPKASATPTPSAEPSSTATSDPSATSSAAPSAEPSASSTTDPEPSETPAPSSSEPSTATPSAPVPSASTG